MKCRELNFTLLLAVLSLLRCSYCTTEYEDIVRIMPANWENPTLSHPAASIKDNRFDEQVSDYIAYRVLKFAHKLGQILVNQTEKAEVFSPVSIMSALALLMLGAKGRSYNELKLPFGIDKNAKLLHAPSEFHTEFGKMLEDIQSHGRQSKRSRRKPSWRETIAGYNIRQDSGKHPQMEHITKIANGLFAQQGYNLNPDYTTTIKSIYQTVLEPVDFSGHPDQSRDHINRWVSKQTYDKIPNIISGSIPREANIILANALYFKGFWEEPFIQGVTITDNFYPDGKQQQPVPVQMMGTAGVFPFYDAVKYDCRIIGLPYQDNMTTMYVIQPNQSDRLKLKQLQRTLSASKIEELISLMTKKSAIIAFPKMHLVRSINMKDMLSYLGIRDIFARGYSDLSLIGKGNLAAQAAAAFPQAQQSAAAFPQAQQSSPAYPTSQAQQHSWPQAVTSQATTPIQSFPMSITFPQSFPPNNNDEFPSLASSIKGSNRKMSLYEENNNNNRYMAKSSRAKRQTRYQPIGNVENALNKLEYDRLSTTRDQSDLYVQDIVHQVDIAMNERGTEAAAATATLLTRTGPDVLFRVEEPFIFLIRHDPTKLVLFYGIINEPEL